MALRRRNKTRKRRERFRGEPPTPVVHTLILWGAQSYLGRANGPDLHGPVVASTYEIATVTGKRYIANRCLG
ncbi:MAG: hypothetical protein BWY06_01644 [Candidatus Latescibacteria bacterium ADurb.Bin168]|nr:MAG: hypothetical protein BWY06_01644 [Candidatus Latescibacteria bacterium ADurb.Bin168]